MRILIIRLGATGDVVRTTALLNVLKGEIQWLTYDHNIILLQDLSEISRLIPWSKNEILNNAQYDLVINL